MYQLRKFASRHRGFVAGLALTFVALLAGTIVSTLLYLSVRAEREKVLVALEESEAVTRFITDTIATPKAQGDGLRVRELFDQAAASLGNRFTDRPAIEARICDIIGEAYRNLGDNNTAARFLQRALDIRRRVLGPRHAATALSLQHCAMLAFDQGRNEDAERLVTEALEIQTELFGFEQDPTLSSREVLGDALRAQGRLAEAIDILRRAHQARLLVNGPTDSRTILSAYRRALAVGSKGFFDEAEPLYKLVIESPNSLGIRKTCRARNALGMIYYNTSRLEKAEETFAENESLLKRYFDDNDHIRLKSLTEIGVLRARQERYEEADRILTDVIDRSRRALGETHTHTLWTTYCLLDDVLIKKEKYERSLPIAERAVRETDRRAPGFLQLLARVHRGLGHPTEAAVLEEEAAQLPVRDGHRWQRHQPQPIDDGE